MVVVGGCGGLDRWSCFEDLNFGGLRSFTVDGESEGGCFTRRDFEEADTVDGKRADVFTVEGDCFARGDVPAEKRALSRDDAGNESFEGIDRRSRECSRGLVGESAPVTEFDAVSKRVVVNGWSDEAVPGPDGVD